MSFGSTVTVADEETGREATYTLVGPTEADLSAGKLSAESPVAKALIGSARRRRDRGPDAARRAASAWSTGLRRLERREPPRTRRGGSLPSLR